MSAHVSSETSCTQCAWEHLPDIYVARSGSLIATALRALAKHFDLHKSYDQHYLATIPIRYKEALLHFIAEQKGQTVDVSGMEVLFRMDFEGTTGAEGITYLNLANTIGVSMEISSLTAFLQRQEYPASDLNINAGSILGRLRTMSPFSTMTHLTLANPHDDFEFLWPNLLNLVPHIGQNLTHLSLAYWPAPTFEPDFIQIQRGYGHQSMESSWIDAECLFAGIVLYWLGRGTRSLR